MARIAGVDLPRDKRIEYGLTYIYGIGLATSREILAKAGVDPDIRVRDLTEEDAGKIRRVIDADYMVEGDLRREVSLNIKRLMEIGSYRGIRHRRGLPSEDKDKRKDTQGPEASCRKEEIRGRRYKLWQLLRRQYVKRRENVRTLNVARLISSPPSTIR